MIKTSKDAAEFADMIDAIDRAMNKNDEAFDFLADLHDAGFMVVPADVVVMEPWPVPAPEFKAQGEQAVRPVSPPPPPDMPLGPDGRPDLDDENPF